jgi:hypothetical protein
MYDFNYKIINEGSLSKGFENFKKELNDQSKSLNRRVQRVQNDIINKVKCFLINQVSESKTKICKANTTETDYKLLLNEMIESKKIYHSLAQSVEETKMNSEVAKANPNIKGDALQKLLNKLYNLTQQAKEAEATYIKNLSHCNSYNDFYIEKTEEILDSFQEMELEYNKFMKQVLVDYYNESINFAKEMLNNAQENLILLSDINPEEDIASMINKNQTNILPPTKLEFTPYMTHSDKLKVSKTIDQTNKNNLNINELITIVRNFVKSTFLSEMPESHNPQESKIFAELKNLMNYAWDGRVFEAEDRKLFNKCMKEKIYRKYFLSCLNKYRIGGMFILDSNAYDNLVELLLCLLDHCTQDKDYESMKFCMILSQTFYKPSNARLEYLNCIDNVKSIEKSSFITKDNAPNTSNTNNNSLNDKSTYSIRDKEKDSCQAQITDDVTTKLLQNQENITSNLQSYEKFISPRIFIQNGLQDHEALTNLENWSGMIKYSIREELSTKSGLYVNDNLANLNVNTIGSEGKEVKNEMLKNISFGQLISFSYNMSTFGFSQEEINGLIKTFCISHDIPPEMQAMIYMKVEECSEEVQEAVKNKLSDDNISHVMNEDFKNYVEMRKTLLVDDNIIKILPESLLINDDSKVRSNMNILGTNSNEEEQAKNQANDNDVDEDESNQRADPFQNEED